ncbi:putative 8-amino-7-oxononanoate synthase [Tolypocladium ophioglossoides CBS 100239]|uniref:Putative 8-amino-7-oxononanoate synthase n=1 Tax=Tolypocladium ophioglossoides (strain CBS 100239) TaxID=1163406 RepID=A0A0L0NKH3_TOLOC|nr:putative 8-amino-7-oxononanoate synthase [Tolypocladium ophioglossoides CBS 100239]
MPAPTTAMMYAGQDLAQIQKWIEGQKLKAPAMKDAPPFYRNLEAALDERRAGHNLVTLHRFEHKVDFSSNDFLSLATSGMLREAFLKELERNPDFAVGSTGSRISDGNNAYMESVESQIAMFHGAETALMVSSGYDANCAIFSAVPRPGDAIVYDELIHAGVHDGMKTSLAATQVPFKHNSADSLRETLVSLKESQSLIRQGTRCVLIAVEAVYSMDGDVTPLAEIVQVVKDIFPAGNAQIVIDEAHSTRLVGKNGRGLVCALGLEKEIAIRLHTYGKGLGAIGGMFDFASPRTGRNARYRRLFFGRLTRVPLIAAILANSTVLNTLLKLCSARHIHDGAIVSNARGDPRRLQDRVQHLVRRFCENIEADAAWDEAVTAGICSMPVSHDVESRPFVTQFLPVWTRQGQNYFLTMHLHGDGYTAIPIDPPVVPRGTGRVRLIIHAGNTDEEVQGLAASICRWAREMLDIQESKTPGNEMPSAMRKVYGLAQAVDVHGLDPSKLAANPFE